MKLSLPRREFLTSLATARVAWTAQPRPNFLVILSDDQGYHDVGCYGSEIPTPHTDSIAQNGIRFEQFYVAGPVCTPSRYGLLTGRYPARSRDRLLSALMPPSQKGIHPGETTLAEVLRDRGYRTALIGKWHLGSAKPEFLPTRHGFQYFDGFTHGCIDYFNFSYGGLKSWYRNEELYQPPKGYTTTYLTDQAVRYLHENRDHPFFLYLPYNAPHYGKLEYDPASKKFRDELQAPEEYIARFSHIKDKNRRVYAATVSALDDGIGRVLDTLRQLRLEDNTLVIFISDNGGSLPYGGSNTPLRGEKGDLFEGGIRTPSMMQWKGRIAPGKVSGQVAASVDVFPTVAAIAGVPGAAKPSDGRDLAPVLFAGRSFERELYWRTEKGAEAYLSGHWKYIRMPDGQEFLFDLQHDSVEHNNLVSDQPRLEHLRAGFLRVKATLP